MCVLTFFLLLAFVLKTKSAFEACSVRYVCSACLSIIEN